MKRFLFAIALIVVLTSACRPVEPWAIVVNGDEISVETIDKEIDAVLKNADYAMAVNQGLGGTDTDNQLQPGGANTVSADYMAQVVSGRVIATLVRQELDRRQITVTPEARSRAEQLFREQYPDPALFDKLDPQYRDYLLDRVGGLLLLLDAETTQEKMRAYYDTHVAELSTFCVRHILVATEAEAQAIRARIVGGEDFAALAKATSLDAAPEVGSGPKGGDLGCFASSQIDTFIPPFSGAVRNLPVNELSQPVETDYGFHLIQVTSRSQQAFEDARGQISQKLGDPTAYIAKLLENAKIEINPRYGEYTPADPESGVGAVIQPHEPVLLRDSVESTSTDPNSLVTR